MTFPSSPSSSRICKPPPPSCDRNPGTSSAEMQPLRHDRMIRERAWPYYGSLGRSLLLQHLGCSPGRAKNILHPPASPRFPPPLQPPALRCSAPPAMQLRACMCGCVCPGVLQGAAPRPGSVCLCVRVCVCVCIYRGDLFACESGRVLRRAVSFIV